MCVVSWALHLGWVKRSKGNGGLGSSEQGGGRNPFFERFFNDWEMEYREFYWDDLGQKVALQRRTSWHERPQKMVSTM